VVTNPGMVFVFALVSHCYYCRKPDRDCQQPFSYILTCWLYFIL